MSIRHENELKRQRERIDILEARVEALERVLAENAKPAEKRPRKNG